MEMSNYEVEVSYRQALDKREQIKILAQLNATNRKEIIGILNSFGHNIKMPRDRDSKFWTDGRINTLIHFLKCGMSVRVAAETLGCSRNSIERMIYRLREEGVSV